MLAAVTASRIMANGALAFPDDAIPNDQSNLQPIVNAGGTELKFDWPMVQVGTAEYREGPTGVTVFRFGRKVTAAYDVRGEPGTANTDWLRLGRDIPKVDAVVLSGGSLYGIESTTAVATAMKDDQLRTVWNNVAYAKLAKARRRRMGECSGRPAILLRTSFSHLGGTSVSAGWTRALRESRILAAKVGDLAICFVQTIWLIEAGGERWPLARCFRVLADQSRSSRSPWESQKAARLNPTAEITN